MGTGSVASLVLKWLGRLPTVPVPFFGRKIKKSKCRKLMKIGREYDTLGSESPPPPEGRPGSATKRPLGRVGGAPPQIGQLSLRA